MIHEKIEKLVSKAVPGVFPEFLSSNSLIEIPKNKDHGDYSTGIALKIARKTKENPVKVAEKIVNGVEKTQEIEKIEIVNPGFINFFLSKSFLKKELIKVLTEKEKYGAGKEKNKTAIIDYSSPNIAKSFGVGHLRSTIIGQTIYNIYEFKGWKCIGDNHLGDWGTQFGKLIYQIKKENKDLEKLTIKDLEKLYVDFHKEAKNNPELEEKGREWFKKLENKDQEAKKIWDFCVKTSIKEFNRIYDLLKIKIDNSLGESFYADMWNEVINELKEKKIVKKSEKALIIEFSEKLPCIVAVKSDGATTYLIRDLAAIKYRIEKWNPDLFVYEVGVDQSLYFKQLFETVRMLGWADEKDFKHVAHGLVRWKHGKFSTRKGETIHLKEILQEAISKSLKIIENSETIKNMSLEEKKKTAEKIGIGAIKYNDLSQHYSKDIVFDWDKMLNLKGNSGPYIQYTFARCMSVLKKGNFVFNDFKVEEIEKEEERILRLMSKFPLFVEEAKNKFSPNIISCFLFDLAQEYNAFYNNHQIIVKDENKKQFRMSLTAGVSLIIKNGLELLGIEAPEKM